MDDIEDTTPILGTPRVELPAQEASVRPGPTAPKVQGGHLEVMDGSLIHAFSRARELFIAARHPYGDPEYAHLKPHLISLASRLSRWAKECPEDAELAELLAEVRSYLPGSFRAE